MGKVKSPGGRNEEEADVQWGVLKCRFERRSISRSWIERAHRSE